MEILCDTPLPEFDSEGGHAFEARARSGGGKQSFYAIVAHNHILPRFEVAKNAHVLNNAAIPCLHSYDIVDWPPAKARLPVFVYETPINQKRCWAEVSSHPNVLHNKDIFCRFLKAAMSALAVLEEHAVVHGGIRPETMFWDSQKPDLSLQLGEFLSFPTGADQPVLFETIVRGMCSPLGKGNGAPSDDCYALGVSLALLVLGHNPWHGREDGVIIADKIEQGSFQALTKGRVVPEFCADLLINLLVDDERQRWGIKDIGLWLSGKRQTSIIPINSGSGGGVSASRSFSFMGQEFWTPRQLAIALVENPQDASRLFLQSNALEEWVRRGCEARESAAKLASVLDRLHAPSAPNPDTLLTRSAMILDPAAPIRYRGLVFFPQGFAVFLANALNKGRPAQPIVDVISNRYVSYWIHLQQQDSFELGVQAREFDSLTEVLSNPMPGFGIEHVAYLLNPSLPCLSPLVRWAYVQNGTQLLAALEIVAQRPDRPTEPIDHHIAAFLVVREHTGMKEFEVLQKSQSNADRGFALLRVYALLQTQKHVGALPHLAAWLAAGAETRVRQFLNRKTRESKLHELKKAATQGKLDLIVNILDNTKDLQNDAVGFANAQRLLGGLNREIASLEKKMQDKAQEIRTTGRPVAAVLAGLIAIAAVIVTLIKFFIASAH